jgi:enamine deaminase RidA (YjgF/YER057c/UK114 family)
MSAEANLKKLGIELPPPPTPAGTYVGAVRSGNLVFLAGAGPTRPDGSRISGKVPSQIDIPGAQAAARLTGLNLLANLRREIGSLDRVKRIVKVFGMVNADPGFENHPTVINGFSDLMVEVFGEAGRHARSAVGLGSLPFQIAVEIEMIVEVE